MKKIMKIILFIIISVVLVLSLTLAYLTFCEYSPKGSEDISIKNNKKETVKLNDSISLTTYNIGYCNDSADSDFFMDGGKRTRIESKAKVIRNLNGIIDNIKKNNSDIIFIQEIDEKSKRGYFTNEVKVMEEKFNKSTSFAKNFSVKYIPYPIKDMIGSIESGILTLNKYKVDNSTRISLPVSFKWPVRICQMKRCLLVQRLKIKDTNKELILVNLHLEAYDDGGGKIKQTKVLTDFINKEYKKGNYIVVGGDFNQTFPGANKDKYKLINKKYFTPGVLDAKSFDSNFNFVYDESLPTSRLLNEEYNEKSKNTQYYVIDGFIISNNIKLLNIKTINTKFNYSDHNPVKLEFKLK